MPEKSRWTSTSASLEPRDASKARSLASFFSTQLGDFLERIFGYGRKTALEEGVRVDRRRLIGIVLFHCGDYTLRFMRLSYRWKDPC